VIPLVRCYSDTGVFFRVGRIQIRLERPDRFWDGCHSAEGKKCPLLWRALARHRKARHPAI
jgi:hypothetical protein